MKNHVSILECIDEINDIATDVEYSVTSAMAHSYLKMCKLFTECYQRGGDPYIIYQEESIMDEVKDKAKNDKNGFVTFFKFVPRLIIAIINKIKNKLINKNKGDISVKASTVEKVNKKLSKKKTGTMVLAGGLVLAVGAAGGISIYKKRPNGKSNQKEDHGVKVEVTKDAKIKTNVDVEAVQKCVMDLMKEMEGLERNVAENHASIEKAWAVMAGLVKDTTNKIEALSSEISGIKKKQAVYEVNGNFNQNNQEIANRLTNLEKEISQIKGDLEEQNGNLALKIAEVLSAGPEAINEAMQLLIEMASCVEELNKQDQGVESKSKETLNEENVNDDAKNLKKFVDTVKNKLPDIKSTIDEDYYNEISGAINKSYKILEGLTNDNSEENLKKKYGILYNIHSAINSVCKETRAFRYEMDRAAKLFKQSEGAKVIEKFLVDVGYRKMTDEFKVGNDFKEVYNKKLGEWFKSIGTCDDLLANDWKVDVKPNQIAMIFRYPYILDMDKLKLGDSAKKAFKMYRDQGMFIIKGFEIFERVEG